MHIVLSNGVNTVQKKKKNQEALASRKLQTSKNSHDREAKKIVRSFWMMEQDKNNGANDKITCK